MRFTFRRWADFGASGIPPTDVTLDYLPSRAYSLTDETATVVAEGWDALTAADDGLFDALGFNLRRVDTTTLRLGPTSFRAHRVRRALLADDSCLPAGIATPAAERELRTTVHLLSSFVAVIADGQLLVGIKPGGASSPPFLSFPGSGYLDRTEDMDGATVAPTPTVIERELREEIGLTARDGTIRCLGVFEDLDPDSHLNPALFSVLETDLSPATVRERASDAPDVDEFTDLAFLAIDASTLSALVTLGLEPDRTDEVVADLPLPAVGQLSHKTLLMVLLLGRWLVGDDWFTDHWGQYPALSFSAGHAGGD